MMKKPEIIDEEKLESRRGGKFSEFGMKMERLFKATFRKDSRNQFKHPNIEDHHVDDEELKENKVNTQEKSLKEKNAAFSGSDSASDTEIGSRHNLVKENLRADGRSPDQTNNIEDKETRVLNTRTIRRLQKSEHVKSKDLESNSMDVVVDIHRENSSAPSPKNGKVESPKEMDDAPSEDSDIEQEILVADVRDKSLNSSPESMKTRQRKRWSKDANIILPPKRNSLSSQSVSDRSTRWADVEPRGKPIPAPRLNKIKNIEEELNFGHDNEAFVSDNDQEEVLMIETHHGTEKSTEVKIKSTVYDSEESLDVSEHRKMKTATKLQKYSHQKLILTADNSPGVSREHESSSTSSKRSRRSSRLPVNTVFTTTDSSGSTSNVRKLSKALSKPSKSDKTTKKHKSQRKRRPTLSHRDPETSRDPCSSKSSSQKTRAKKSKKLIEKRDETKLISVKIHRADMLVPEYITKHPMVIVHIVEASTGNYLKDPGPSTTNANYLQPLITGTFDFKENKTMVPCWEEELIFEHDFGAISPEVLILFEIVDLPSFADASSTYDEFGGGNCWYKIAWAFLKPLSSSGASHINKIVRLQLYKPRRSSRKPVRPRCDAYNWWRSGSRDKYPSTLYVSVTSVDPPKLEPVFYGQLNLEEPEEEVEPLKSVVPSIDVGNISRWSRLAAQSCKIPNELLFKTDMTDNGCFYTVFSNNGQFLACATCEEYDYPIIIYKIDEAKVFVRFSGHKSFVYALDWSNSDEMVLSVSSDQTARLWDVKNKIVQEINMLPHPSYVYCGKFEPMSCQIVVTGCYDRVIRLWSRDRKARGYELTQELEGHEGYVNSICFIKDGDFLTGDSVGMIIQWTIKKRRGRSSKDWQISRKIKIREIVNIPINTIVLHPLGSRLLVHSRDSGLRMLDLATGVVLQRYSGLKNLRIQTAAKISPCGGLLLCGGEDATLNVWSIESGKHVAKYNTSSSNSSIASVDYHPYDHVLVYSIFGIPSEVTVLIFNKQSSGESVGLKLSGQVNSSRGIQDIISATPGSPPRQRHLRKMVKESEDRLGQHRFEVNESQDDLRSRLKMFSDSEGLLKTQSANRLSNIIAKIDRILLNSSSAPRSYDVEANRFTESCLSKFSPRQENHITPYVPPLFSTLEDNSTSGSKSEAFEMIDIPMKAKTTKRRSKSAQHPQALEHHKYDKTASDGAAPSSHRKSKGFQDFCTTMPNMDHFKPDDVACHYKENNDQSSSGSRATYVLDDKSDSEKFESESSVRSDVTFVIESEKRISSK